jgi:hypothetical protein
MPGTNVVTVEIWNTEGAVINPWQAEYQIEINGNVAGKVNLAGGHSFPGLKATIPHSFVWPYRSSFDQNSEDAFRFVAESEPE